MRVFFLSMLIVAGCNGCDEPETDDGGGSTSGGQGPGGNGTGGLGGEGPIGTECEDFDSATDPLHCGVSCEPCGIGTCVDGTCQTAEVLASGIPTAADLATDGSQLFFASGGTAAALYLDGSVQSLPIAGGEAPTILADDIASAEGVALSGDNVVFSSTGTQANDALDGFIARVAKTGGPVDTVAAQQPWALHVVARGDDLFWPSAGTFSGDFQDGTIKTAADDVVATLAGPDAYPVSVALDNDYIYWTSAGSAFDANAMDAAVRRLPLAGGPIETIAEGLDRASGIAVVGGTLFFATKNEIVSAPTSDLTMQTTFATTLDTAMNLAADDENLYWTEAGSVGHVMRQSLTGGPAIVIAENLHVPHGLVLSGANVYFTVRGSGVADGAVMTIPK